MKKILTALLLISFFTINSQKLSETKYNGGRIYDLVSLEFFYDFLDGDGISDSNNYKPNDPFYYETSNQYEVNNFHNRIYIKGNGSGIEAFRENLEELLGKIIYTDGESIELGGVTFAKDSIKIKVFAPKNGTLKRYKYTFKDNKEIGLFINASVTKEDIFEYYINDESRAILKNNQIHLNKLKQFYENGKANLKDAKLVNAVTVTEITKRKYKKGEKKLKASSLPGIASAFTYEGTFFVSTEDFVREYKIGLSAISLKRIYDELVSIEK